MRKRKANCRDLTNLFVWLLGKRKFEGKRRILKRKNSEKKNKRRKDEKNLLKLEFEFVYSRGSCRAQVQMKIHPSAASFRGCTGWWKQKLKRAQGGSRGYKGKGFSVGSPEAAETREPAICTRTKFLFLLTTLKKDEADSQIYNFLTYLNLVIVRWKSLYIYISYLQANASTPHELWL